MELEEWKDSLTKEQLDALKACKTGQEQLAYCKDNKIAVPDEVLAAVAGGAQQANDCHFDQGGLAEGPIYN